MADIQRLTIVQINDVHAYLDIHPEMFLENGEPHYRYAGGYGRIATLLKGIKEENPAGVMTFDNGDTFHGTYHAVKSKGEALIPILNGLQIDAMTGHWEFAYGPDQFRKITSKLNYPMLANNCYDKETNKLIFSDYKIIERRNIKIGVIGIAAHIIDKSMPPIFSKGVCFTLGNEELPKIIKFLRAEKGVDLIIVLSHFGFPQDVKLAEEVAGIDILLSSHTHNRLCEPVIVNKTIIIQSGCHGAFIGKLDVYINEGNIIKYDHKLIEVSEEIKPDEYIQKLVDEVLATDREELDTVIGETATVLDRYGQLETTMDNLLLEALLNATDAELAFSNGWRYGAPILPGEITMNDLWNIIPTNPPVSTAELTGEEILTMVEENLNHTFASDPYEQMGGYVKRVLGMKLFVKLENPVGTRIQNLFIRGEQIDKNKKYAVVFVTEQGVPSKYGTNRKNLDIKAIDALKNYVQQQGLLSVNLSNTVEVI